MAQAFKKLHALGPDVVQQVDERLLKGDAPSAVAAWLQEECQVLLDLKPASLKKSLERYRSKDLRDRVVRDLTEKIQPQSVHGMRKKIVALDELEEVAVIQRSRLDKLLVHEQQLPKGIVLKQASDEMRLLKETLVELGRLQLETGVMRRAPKVVSGTLTDPTTGETRAFSWTEESEALLGRINQLEHTEIPDAEVADD